MRTSISLLQSLALALWLIGDAGICGASPEDVTIQVQVFDAETGWGIPYASIDWLTIEVPIDDPRAGGWGQTSFAASYSFTPWYGSGYTYEIKAHARNYRVGRFYVTPGPGLYPCSLSLDPVDGTPILDAGPGQTSTVSVLPFCSDLLWLRVYDSDVYHLRDVYDHTTVSVSNPSKISVKLWKEGSPIECSWQYTVNSTGTYYVTFEYKDEYGDVGSDIVEITIQSLTGNQCPVVNAGPDISTTANFLPWSLRLEGTAYDPDNGPLQIAVPWWDVVSSIPVDFDDPTDPDTSATFNGYGSYLLSLNFNDGECHVSDIVRVTINEKGVTTVQGAVTDAVTGNPIPDAYVALVDVDLGDSFVDYTDSTGFYCFASPIQFEDCDGVAVIALHYIKQEQWISVTPGVANTYDFAMTPTDGKPIVYAGPDATYQLPSPPGVVPVELHGSVDDPDWGPDWWNTPTWTKVSGPGTVTFTDWPTFVWFSTYGEYVLKLEYSDGEYTVADTVTITIEPAQGDNECPEVDAGPASMTATVNVPLALQGSASDPDDGPQALTIEWSKTSGPGTVTFQDKGNPTTTATFGMVGTYVLRLWCNDGACDDSDTVSVEVTAGGGSGTIPWIRAAYWDTRYSTSWVHGSAIRDALQSAGYEVLNADQLALWMDARILDGKPSVVVFCQDLAPDTVYEAASSSCTLREYLDAGGKIVWYGDIPLYYQGHSNGMRTEFGTGGSLGALGFNAAGGVWDRGEQVTLTEDGRSWGLTQTWVSTRPASGANLRVLARDSAGQAAGWVKHFVSGDGYRGFVRFSDSGAVPGVADVRRVAEYPNTPALVAHWTLDGDAADSAGGHDGALYGNPVWLPTGGKIGGALKFDGKDDYVDTKFTQNLAKWTICCWVSSPAAPSNSPGSGPIHREQNLQINWNHSDPKFRSAAGLSVGGTWYAASFGTLAANTWYHLAATYDGVSLKAYRDGELITTTPCPGTPASEASSLKLGRHAVQANFFSGTIDDVYVYSSALGQSEIQALMGTGVLSILEVVDNGIIDDEQMCRTSLDSTTGTRVEYTAAVLNLHDSGPSGHFGNDQPFGVVKEGRKTAGSVDNLSLRAEGVIHISAAQAGNWTFGVNSDDGFTLLFPGRNFTSVTNGELYSTAQGKAIRFFGGRALADTLGVIHLPAGDHPFWLTYHEGVLEAAVEFFAAQGVYTAFDPQVFHLVGQ